MVNGFNLLAKASNSTTYTNINTPISYRSRPLQPFPAHTINALQFGSQKQQQTKCRSRIIFLDNVAS